MREKLRVNGLYNATIQRRIDRRAGDGRGERDGFDRDAGYRAHFDGLELKRQINRPRLHHPRHGLASRASA